MKTFLGYNIDSLNSDFSNSIISISDNKSPDYWINTMYYCYKNSITCFIGNNSSTDFEGIVYNHNNKSAFITWKYLFKMNKFFCKKMKTIFKFDIDHYDNFYNIFFIEFHAKNKSNVPTDKKFLSTQNAFIGIYDSFQEYIEDCDEKLYYSYSLNKFLLYRVKEKDDYLYGKLLPDLSVKNNKLITDNSSYDIPSSFLEFNKNIYGIKKRDIKITLKSTKILNATRDNKNFVKFCNNYRNENIYYLQINRHLNKNIIQKLYKFLVIRFPILENDNNNLFIEPQNIDRYKSYFSMYLVTNKIQYLVIHFNQVLFQYIDHIVHSIDEFFTLLSNSDNITTHQYVLEYNKGDKYIHIVSEIYYLIVIIILKIPFILKNLNFIEDTDEDYTQINYKFSKDEIEKLNKQSDNSYSDYLLKIVINSIAIFMENYYLFVQQNSNIDIIPIYSGLDNKTIDNYLNRSRKATYSKGFLISYLSNFFIGMNNKNIEVPVIFVNIMELKKSSLIKIDKIHGINKNKNIPMLFNIVYSKNDLLITVSFKPKYKKIKYFFNEIISQILEN